MIDYHALERAIAAGITYGLQDGAAHIAEALAKPAPSAVLWAPFGPDVTVAQVKEALTTLRQAYNADDFPGAGMAYDSPARNRMPREAVRDAWAIVVKVTGAST